MSIERAAENCIRCYIEAEITEENIASGLAPASVFKRWNITDYKELSERLENRDYVGSNQLRKEIFALHPKVFDSKNETMKALEKEIESGQNIHDSDVAKEALGICLDCPYRSPKVFEFVKDYQNSTE